jgi:hypothetical protein
VSSLLHLDSDVIRVVALAAVFLASAAVGVRSAARHQDHRRLP